MIRRVVVLALVAASQASAQSLSDAPSIWTFTAATNGSLASATVGIARSATFGPGDRFAFGIGLRLGIFSGNANATPEGSAFMPRGIHDTLFVPVSAESFNVTAHLATKIGEKLEAGIDVDLMGLATGGSRLATYRDSARAPNTSVNASPGSPNIFGGFDASGTASTNFYLAWPLTERVTLRGGYSRQTVSYKTDTPLSSNTQDFRAHANMFFVGVTLVPRGG